MNGEEEGKVRMGEGGRDEKVVSSKKKPELKTSAKIDTQFMTQTAEKNLPLGAAHIYTEPI